MNKFDYLYDYGYVTEKELILVIKCWGDNEETYNKICYCRYGYQIDQLAELDGVIIEDE